MQPRGVEQRGPRDRGGHPRGEGSLPFDLRGFDTDNGSEFYNWHLVRYLQQRSKAFGFTRSRPYKKNDNGHVEQKNWTHIRQLLGYDRLDDPELVEAINTLYRDCWEPLHNYFLPSATLDRKTRDGAKVKRRHDGEELDRGWGGGFSFDGGFLAGGSSSFQHRMASTTFPAFRQV